MADHVVTFTAEDGWMIARCGCGWFHRWRPWKETADHPYMIMNYGLEHTLDATGTELRTRDGNPT